MINDVKIFYAKWILPISKGPIENGGIAIKNDSIVGIGDRKYIRDNFKGDETELGNYVIFPGFINVHTHLEHCVIEHKVDNYLHYLEVAKIELNSMSQEQKKDNCKQNIEKSIKNGVVAMADFSHMGDSAGPLNDSKMLARVFHELNSLKSYEAKDIFNKHKQAMNQFEQNLNVTQHFAANSLWRNSKQLLREISVKEQHIGVHMAVTPDELEFFMTGKGRLQQFLLNQEEFDYGFVPPEESPFLYFMNNHFYAKHNILIHMLHVTEEEIKKINDFQTKINVCICPRSTEVLSLGKPDVQMFLRNSINICLGTESPSLVPDMDMKKELIKCIDDFHVRPEIAMKFVTLNGAYAIGFHREVGSLDAGKTSRCLYINIDEDNITDPYEAILSSGNQVNWLDEK